MIGELLFTASIVSYSNRPRASSIARKTEITVAFSSCNLCNAAESTIVKSVPQMGDSLKRIGSSQPHFHMHSYMAISTHGSLGIKFPAIALS